MELYSFQKKLYGLFMNFNSVDELRFYSRELIREFGFLNDLTQCEELNFAQIHLLIECERYGVIEQHVLADNLRVNKSWVSRLIKSLLHLGYVTYGDARPDKRNKSISLAPMGVMKVKVIHEQARAQVLSALNYLSTEEQLQISAGLKAYSGALKKARKLDGIIIRPIEPQDNQSMCLLIKSVLGEFGANKAGFAFTDEETNSMYEFYQGEGKQYFVAQKGANILGGIGFAPLEGASLEVGELRKMYLVKEARGLGLGYELLQKVLHTAKTNYSTLYLETLSRMSGAISLYHKVGFNRLIKPMGNTGHFGCDVWMAKDLV